MAFEVANFKEFGGPGNSPDGGQIYSVFSETDTTVVMMTEGYLNALFGILNVLDNILFSGSDAVVLAQVTSITESGVISVNNVVINGTPQQITGAGTIDLISDQTLVTTTAADAFTLADGDIDQEKDVTLEVDGGDATLTPASRLGFSSITFEDIGDSVKLLFTSGGWAVIGLGGPGIGPTVNA